MITTVMFDMGGTLEDVFADEATYRRTSERVLKLLAENGMPLAVTPQQFWDKAFPQFMVYKDESVVTGMEKKPEEIWTQYVMRGFDVDMGKIAALSEELAHLWEVSFFTRRLRPGVLELLTSLKSAGYRLGVVSNTPSLFQVFDILDEYGIRHFFDGVTVSSIVGYRKPLKRIFEIALYQMNVKPENCAYVGDTVARDILGAQRAGYAKTFQIHSFLTDSRDTPEIKKLAKPDYLIENLPEVYNILESLKKA